MSKQVDIDIVLPQPPERVWRAITDAKALAKWLMPNDFRPRLGHRFRFVPKRGREREKGPVIECEVIELDAPRRLTYTWRERAEDAPDLVTWVLEPLEAGTRVRLEHTRLTDLQACASAPSVLASRSVAPAKLLLGQVHLRDILCRAGACPLPILAGRKGVKRNARARHFQRTPGYRGRQRLGVSAGDKPLPYYGFRQQSKP